MFEFSSVIVPVLHSLVVHCMTCVHRVCMGAEYAMGAKYAPPHPTPYHPLNKEFGLQK